MNMRTTLRLNQHIGLMSFVDAARESTHPVAIKLSSLHGFSGGYISRITKDGAYVKSYTSPDAGVFLTNEELNMRTAVSMGVAAAR